MPTRRLLSLWFPRFGAERLIRLDPGLIGVPLAVLRDTGQMQVVESLSAEASAAGVHIGQPFRDAQAICPELVTRLQNPQAEAAFLSVLCRWAGKYSPWVAQEPPAALMLDITGCAHLFGGEAEMLAAMQADCAVLGLQVEGGVADTPGAAWALARFAGSAGAESHRSGDAIDQEARATRSRAVKRRHWTKGGAAPAAQGGGQPVARIAPPGQMHRALAALPVAALRIEPATREALARLGLRQVGDVLGQPRASLARRFGQGLVLRIDQALGGVPEPISPAKATPHFAVRMTLPDPIGLFDDVMAAVERLLERLCDLLRDKGQGARVVRLQAYRADQTMQWVDVGLARASDQPERIRPLLAMKVSEVEAGYGIDMLRLAVVRSEALPRRKQVGHLDAARTVMERQAAEAAGGRAMEDLFGRIGARIGLERVTRLHPAESHIPEKEAQVMAAAWSEPHEGEWPAPVAQRPLCLWRPEPVMVPDHPRLPECFRFRGRDLQVAEVVGPERIAPEWWLDDPLWRSGTRDYWQVDCRDGTRLWLFYAHGGTMSSGWFCQGSFA